MKKAHGMGIIAIVRNPRRDVAHAKPRVCTMCGAKRGKEEEIVKRRKVVAAKADAL